MFKSAKTSITITARRTEISDAKDVIAYVNQSTVDLFGACYREIGRVFEMIEKSVLSITIEDQSDKRLLAQACFNDFPNVYGVSPQNWEQWLSKRYESTKLSTFNTLFMHLFVADPEFSIACAQEIVKSVFKTVPECHYVLLCVPNNMLPEKGLASIFVEMKRSQHGSSSANDDKCVVLVANREKHLPVLHIRSANVNDNDDLIPLLNSYTNVLKATYGDFYVAEMIEAQNDTNKCLTAEAEGFGIGFMAITRDVNVDLLNECFELIPFHGLHKPHEDDVIVLPKDREPEDDSNGRRDSRGSVKHKLSYAEILKTDELDNEFNMKNDFENAAESIQLKGRNKLNHDNQASSSGGGATYYGEPNAFAIQLFCIEEKYDSRSMDFLPKAFEAFPDKDYCIITLPPNVPEFSLIQNFLRITPKDTNKINQELYIFHRAGLIKSFEVREATRASDLAAVERVVKTIKSRESIMKDLRTYQKSRKDGNGLDVEAYVAEALGRVIGVAVIRQEADIEYLRSNYNIEDFVLFQQHKAEEHAHVNHFALIPIFSFLTKFFIREIMRKSKKTCFYYPIYPEYCIDDMFERYSLITAINHMVPVRRRPQIEYNLEKLKINAPSDRVLKPKFNYQMPFSLNHINRKLLFEPKISINLRIVVVGASELGLSFLETLVMSPHLRFNNLTLVSTNGAPGSLIPDSLRDRMIPETLNYDQLEHASISLRSWINTVNGKLTAINRRKKYILINDGSMLHYDHLVLCTGSQYYHIAPMDARVYNAQTKKDMKPHLGRPLLDTPPSNMFVVNDDYDSEDLIYFINKNHIRNRQEHIVFYGLDLNALSAIQVLLDLDIQPERIVIVCDNKTPDVFNNPFVTARIGDELKKLNIKVYENFQMQSWNNGTWEPGHSLKSVLFVGSDQESSSEENLELVCCMLLCYLRKDVDYSTFVALNNCHLVYDGRLVIDNEFHTNDSCIRAGGKLTKFKRSYYVDSWSHAYFNQKEIGLDMAYRFLKLIDPLLREQEAAQATTLTANSANNASDQQQQQQQQPPSEPSTARSSKTPDENFLIKLYKKPIVSFAFLPGGYYYLHVTKPGPLVTYEEERIEREELTTNTQNGYFRLHLNGNKCVTTITCLSKKRFNAMNFMRLYGLHEQFLNKLMLKYSHGQINDFYDFFSESWCIAIYHDRFDELRKELRDLSINPMTGIKSVSDLLSEFVDKDLILTKDQLSRVKEHFTNSQTRTMIEKRILSYLNYNSYQLPMYSKPDLV